LHRNNLAEAARLLKDENWVIEPDIPIDDIIKSATLIGKLFYGRYVIKELGAASCGGVRLTPELIADKYGRVRSGPQWGEFPAATAEQVWWISKRGCDRIQLVSFGEGATNDIRGLQFAIKVSLGELDTVVSRVVLFDWRKVLPGDFPEAGNGKAMEALTRIHDKASYIPYLDAVGKAVQEALRRLITENRRQEVF
jgi:hypothetical protein